MMSSRKIFAIIALACIGLLAYGYYLQFFTGLEPCPLCIFQRLAYIFIAAISTIAAIHGPERPFNLVYFALIDLGALTGAAIAGRQVWLQHLPADKVPECGPGLDYMLEVFPLSETLEMVFTGSGECAEVDWTFLGFSIAEWSLAMFIVIMTACFYGIVSGGMKAKQS